MASQQNGNRGPEVNDGVINGIAIVVTLVWATSFLADIFLADYNPPTEIHMIMLAIVGSLFGLQATKKRTNGD